MNKTYLAKNVKYLRSIWGHSVQTMAAKLGVDESFIISLEKGHEFFSMKTLTDIGDLFKVSCDQLLTRDMSISLESSLNSVEDRAFHVQLEIERFGRFNFTDEELFEGSQRKLRDLCIWLKNLLKAIFPLFQECLRIAKEAIDAINRGMAGAP